MAIQIISAVFFVTAVAMIVLCYLGRSPFHVIYLGRPYVVHNESIQVVVSKIYWSVDGQYWISCKALDGEDAPIKLPLSAFIFSHNGNPPAEGELISLVRLMTSEGVVYTTPKYRFGKYFQLNNNIAQLENSEVDELNKRSELVFAASILSAVFSLLIIENSLVSIAFAAFSILTQILFCPHLNWKNSNSCCIIRKNETEPKKSGNGDSSGSGVDSYPLGYDYWSDTRKQLFQMDRKAQMSSAAAEYETNAETTPQESNMVQSVTIEDKRPAEVRTAPGVTDSRPAEEELVQAAPDTLELIGIEPVDGISPSQNKAQSSHPKNTSHKSDSEKGPNDINANSEDSAPANNNSGAPAKKRSRRPRGHRRRGTQAPDSDVGRIIQGIDSDTP